MNMRCKICKSITATRYSHLYDDRHGYPGFFDVKQCQSCGFMQTKPQLSSRKLTQIYTNYYPKRDANIDEIINNSKKLPSKADIAKNGWKTTCHYQTKKRQKVLDIGCGTCQSLLEIKRLGGEAWGIDPDKNSQNVARKLKLRFHLGTIHNCKFQKNYFDLITASQVIEHEPNPIKFLKDSKKFLGPGGKIILSFPNTGALGLKIWRREWLHWHIPFHLNHFNKTSVILMVKEAGLKIVSIETVTPNLWTILQLRSYLNNVRMGERDVMWDGNSNTKGSKKKIYNFLSMANKFLVLNRFLDYLTLGESFVITLSR